MYKKIISICFILAILTSLVGCAFDNHNNDSQAVSSQSEKERVIEQAQRYLENKYPDDMFTYVSSTANVMGILYYELNFKSQKYEESFKVYANPKAKEDSMGHVISRYKDEEGNTLFDYYDTYYNCLMRGDAENYFYEILKQYLGENVVFILEFNSSFYTAREMKNKVDFYSYLDTHCDIYLLCCGENKYDSIYNQLSALTYEFQNCELYMMFDYACVKSEYIDSIEDQSYDDILKNCKKMFYERKEYYINGFNDIYECDLIQYDLY